MMVARTSDNMTQQEFTTLVRDMTKTNSTTFTDPDLLLIANTYLLGEIADAIIKANEDTFGWIFTRDLVLDQREYAFPEDLVKIKEVEMKIDGSNWKPVKDFDITRYDKTTDEDTIRFQFAEQDPMFDIFRNSIFIYSGEQIIPVDEGLKLWAISMPAKLDDLTNSTRDMSENPTVTQIGFPKRFHRLLAVRTSRHYKETKDRPIPLTTEEGNYQGELQRAIDSTQGTIINANITPPIDRPFDDGSDL